jgi:hypothetical protein
MPTFRIGGFKMRFYANDHPPAHVHCRNNDGIVIVEIATGLVLDRLGKIRETDVVRAVALVEEHRDRLLTEWFLFDMRRRDVR